LERQLASLHERSGFELPVPLVQANMAASCPFRFLR
jgi:hypothetical protein